MGDADRWEHRQYSAWMLVTGVAAGTALLVIAAVGPVGWSAALLALVIAGAFLLCGAIKVTVSPAGVTVASLLVPFVRRHVGLHRITKASARFTRALELGGWGYRLRPGVRAVSLRTGDAMWLHLTNGTRFVVTVDDAATAARLVNDHLARDGGTDR